MKKKLFFKLTVAALFGLICVALIVVVFMQSQPKNLVEDTSTNNFPEIIEDEVIEEGKNEFYEVTGFETTEGTLKLYSDYDFDNLEYKYIEPNTEEIYGSFNFDEEFCKQGPEINPLNTIDFPLGFVAAVSVECSKDANTSIFHFNEKGKILGTEHNNLTKDLKYAVDRESESFEITDLSPTTQDTFELGFAELNEFLEFDPLSLESNSTHNYKILDYIQSEESFVIGLIINSPPYQSDLYRKLVKLEKVGNTFQLRALDNLDPTYINTDFSLNNYSKDNKFVFVSNLAESTVVIYDFVIEEMIEVQASSPFIYLVPTDSPFFEVHLSDDGKYFSFSNALLSCESYNSEENLDESLEKACSQDNNAENIYDRETGQVVYKIERNEGYEYNPLRNSRILRIIDGYVYFENMEKEGIIKVNLETLEEELVENT